MADISTREQFSRRVLTYIPAAAPAVLQRRSGKAPGLWDPRTQAFVFLDSSGSFPPQGQKGYPGPTGHPGERGEGCSLRPPPSSPSLAPAPLPVLGLPPCPVPRVSSRARRLCLPSLWGPHQSPPPLPQLHLPERAGVHMAQCWHEPLDSG